MAFFRSLRSSWPIRLAKVAGESMAPRFRDGDLILVHWFAKAPEGLRLLTPVLIERDLMPGVLFIKRIQKVHGALYWVEGDNRDPKIEPLVNDSRSWGYINSHEIRGRVLFRLNPHLKWFR